jgi:UDP-N-acetylmuramoyl-L-alanyl-D-glutamate--2,6-diaminopimelate ligase
MGHLKTVIRSLTPRFVISLYHRLFPLIGSWWFGNPSHKLVVVAVTGTKGKSSTIEYLNALYEAAGYNTALLSGIRKKVGATSERNVSRLSTPGRFAIQRFLAEAVRAQCTHAIIEMTSEGSVLHRHKNIEFDGLIFTNLAPEHIESHGGLAQYIAAKIAIGKAVAYSPKPRRVLVAPKDDAVTPQFTALPFTERVLCSVTDAHNVSYTARGSSAVVDGVSLNINFPGAFSLMNALLAIRMAQAHGVSIENVALGLKKLTSIPGRAQFIDEGQPFDVVVDYAHTKESLEALYASFPNRRKICVLGATGGGRDTWKRPVMGAAADTYCDEIILTNEDPYNEDPDAIVAALRSGIKTHTPSIIMDRKEAVQEACRRAQPGDVVLVTGKGTDPTIQGPRGSSIPWSDEQVCREALTRTRA